MEYQKEKQSACKMCCLNNSSRAIALISTIGLTAITCGTYPFYECYAQRQDTKRLLQVRPSQISNIRSAALAESRSPVSPLEFLRNTPAKQEMHS
ncbi:MAG: hypothetical protein COT85_02205 [Chlamydiae bacterium CG10_big_fil_rev_8_21_14_0_10_42_34]|nr:MAG: hypothetical protein COT85_02205 [Chlamydiae bacterium CG10_big_fil_rev_8_21_14_0_10_42_34]